MCGLQYCPSLWHTMEMLSSQQGVHQRDPLWPFLFALVLQKLVLAIGDAWSAMLVH